MNRLAFLLVLCSLVSCGSSHWKTDAKPLMRYYNKSQVGNAYQKVWFTVSNPKSVPLRGTLRCTLPDDGWANQEVEVDVAPRSDSLVGVTFMVSGSSRCGLHTWR